MNECEGKQDGRMSGIRQFKKDVMQPLVGLVHACESRDLWVRQYADAAFHALARFVVGMAGLSQ